MTASIRCLCGAVQVPLEGEPSVQFYCYCDDCQANRGGAYIGPPIYPASSVTVVQGLLDAYTLKTMPCKRCAMCGASMLAEVPSRKQIGLKSDRLPHGCSSLRLTKTAYTQCYRFKTRCCTTTCYPAQLGGSDELIDW